ncbi:2-C-methyl-D-erythritol 4-phosphate cytidylyltransferase [Gilvimarinus sp. SDUM040013]|uniref:2-C-methyl-D-erythritol 4-phosphate cytidylyltransferase n=1 Tax=Gilvimarinus gilvus TaxID=3058038 RepID=A0ABU4RT54_9GAMM|nr:2-C-methyl-D-erythritol 4-phosphate cytidylyltransferase [Gilvimarinus sp. SDUM040013]MDO3387044.1 2-C-methyl-D-erythritol 4-phosphate cytidylyltransferase [Gilvimarinus sp. SDUM040013]MDX6848062.1 2-C-methyl-D-erythritol 4-phosphate cytidylyltransferase [Gilvimarinus sp. SDUM040013]
MAEALRRAAIIPAAGLGTRLNKGPKAFLTLGNRTLIEWVAHSLAPIVDSIVIAVPEGFEHQATILLPDCTIITGGNSRHGTIANLFNAIDAKTVLIQDAARPFASRELHEAVFLAAEAHGAAGAFIDPVVPVGRINGGDVSRFWRRDEVGIFQAPQAYSHAVLAKAMQAPDGNTFQSTAQLVISRCQSLAAVPGEAENIKITTQLDWDIAEKVIAPKLGHKYQ